MISHQRIGSSFGTSRMLGAAINGRSAVACRAGPSGRKQLQQELAMVLASISLVASGPAMALGLESVQLPDVFPQAPSGSSEAQKKAIAELDESFGKSDTLKVGALEGWALMQDSRLCVI